MRAFVPQWWYCRVNFNTLIGAAILFWACGSEPIIFVENWVVAELFCGVLGHLNLKWYPKNWWKSPYYNRQLFIKILPFLQCAQNSKHWTKQFRCSMYSYNLDMFVQLKHFCFKRSRAWKHHQTLQRKYSEHSQVLKCLTTPLHLYI